MLGKEDRVVVDFCNLLIHNYFGVDADELWDVIQNDLADFKAKIRDKIKLLDSELKKEIIKDIAKENKHLDFVLIEIKSLK